MEHGQTRPDLLGEGEQVQLGTQAPVVTAFRLLQLVQVGGEGLLRLPGRSVDPLQLRTFLVAPPVRAGHPHEPEMTETAGRRHMGPAAQVGERRRVPVGRDLGAGIGRPGIDLLGAGAHGLDDLALERLVLEQRQPLGDRVFVADERLVLGQDLPHGRFDAVEIIVAEVRPAGQLEVIVEAVLDHRTDGEVRARPQPQHGLGQDVGGGMP